MRWSRSTDRPDRGYRQRHRCAYLPASKRQKIANWHRTAAASSEVSITERPRGQLKAVSRRDAAGTRDAPRNKSGFASGRCYDPEIAFVTIARFLSLQPDTSCGSIDRRRTQRSPASPPEDISETRFVYCGPFGLSEIRDHRHIVTPQCKHCIRQTTRRYLGFSEYGCSKAAVQSIASVRCVAVGFLSPNPIRNLVPELRLCMAASSHAQHNERASRPKRLSVKQIWRVAQNRSTACCRRVRNISAFPPNFVRRISKNPGEQELGEQGVACWSRR